MVPLRKHRKSMRRTLVLSTLTVHLAVLAVTLLINAALLSSLSESQALKSGLSNLEYMEYQMDNLVSNLMDIRRLLIQDQNVTEYLSAVRSADAEDFNRRISVNHLLSRILQSYNYLDSITLFQWDGTILNVSRSQVSQSGFSEVLPIQNTPPFREIVPDTSLVWGGCYLKQELSPNSYSTNTSTEKVVAMLMPLIDIWNPAHVSVVSINIPRSHFDFLYSKNVNSGSNVYLYNEAGEYLMDVSSNGSEKVPENNYGKQILGLSSRTGSFTGHYGDGKSKVIFRQDSQTGWFLAEEIPNAIYLRDMMQLQSTTGLTFTVSILLVVVISYFVSRRLLDSFGKMSSLMADIGKGDLSKRLPDMEYRELDELTAKFNSMMEQLEQLMRKNQRYEQEKRELEIEALQAQINPHFIYNSLTTIRWMASMARAGNVCQALLALNNVLQPVFSQPGILWSLSSELNFVQNFLDIMNYRFGGEIQCRHQVDEELRQFPVLRFLLQPVVENSISHGLRSKPGSVIDIQVRQEEAALCIQVSDNGSGIEPETLERLNRSFAETSRPNAGKGRRGFGLYNVNRRIKLQYGAGYGLTVRSEPGEGTVVTVRIPAEPLPWEEPPSDSVES